MTKFKKQLFLLSIHMLILAPSLFAMGQQPNSDPNAPPPPAWVSWVPLAFMIFIFYFLLIRPQSKQRRERQNMLDNLKKGDKIITQGGLYATIVNIGPNFLDVKINEETKVRIARTAISDVIVDKPETKTSELTKK